MRRHPIIALWSHPRSMSTAVERVMRERGDLTCFHEPFMHYYYTYLGVKTMPHASLDPTQATTFSDVVARLRASARSSPVFFKDMSYYIVPVPLFEHAELAHEFENLFLIRDPRRSIVSYYKLDSDLRLDEIGLEAQWRHANWVQENTGETPLVVEAEDIQRDPRKTVRAVWRAAGLSDAPHAFEWRSAEVPADWQQVAGWHRSATDSSKIEAGPPEDEVTIQNRFDETAANAPKLLDYLSHHWPFYERLRQMAFRI
ncbi:MAG: hypothetical protein ACR2RL_16540 [Gammaproteobacteria bacterium]